MAANVEIKKKFILMWDIFIEQGRNNPDADIHNIDR